MITAEMLAQTLNEMGIDTQEKLVAFLRPAAIAAELRTAEAQLTKMKREHELSRTAQADAHAAAVQQLEEQIANFQLLLEGE